MIKYMFFMKINGDLMSYKNTTKTIIIGNKNLDLDWYDSHNYKGCVYLICRVENKIDTIVGLVIYEDRFYDLNIFDKRYIEVEESRLVIE